MDSTATVEIKPPVPNLFERFSHLENPVHAQEREKVGFFLHSMGISPAAMGIVNHAMFMNNCAWDGGQADAIQYMPKVTAEVATAIAQLIPVEPKEKTLMKTQLVAMRQTLRTILGKEVNPEDEKVIPVKEIDEVYNPAAEGIDYALEYF